ncbi:hypothetical protein AAC387_Pa03g0484 [Persea americana]
MAQKIVFFFVSCSASLQINPEPSQFRNNRILYLPLSSPAKMNWQRLESCVAVWRRSSSPILVAASSANQEPKRTQHPLFRLSWISKQSDRVAHSRSKPIFLLFCNEDHVQKSG